MYVEVTETSQPQYAPMGKYLTLKMKKEKKSRRLCMVTARTINIIKKKFNVTRGNSNIFWPLFRK